MEQLGIIKSNAEIRESARKQLVGRWGPAILAYFIITIIVGLPGAIPDVGWVITLLIAGPFTLGQTIYSIKFKRGEQVFIENIFDGFKRFSAAFVLQILISLFVLLWSLLLIVPGVIAYLGYSQAFYILNDNPGLTATEALNRSKEMMKGYRGKLFMLQLSFLGWGILCILTLGIGFLWLVPYMNISFANFYDNLKNSHGSF